jgi:hypothetical protein
MARKLMPCQHCQGKKNCSKSGGRSCQTCLQAAGRGPRDWATVRCSFCGGMGRVWVEEEEPAAETKPAE